MVAMPTPPVPRKSRRAFPDLEKVAALSAAGRKAAAARHSTDTLIKQIVDRAPELTSEQASRLRAIFADAA